MSDTATSWVHFRAQPIRAPALCDQRCAGVRQLSIGATEWVAWRARRALRGEANRSCRARWTVARSPRKQRTVRSMPWPAAGTQATLRLKGLSSGGAVDESDAHRRHPVVEPPKEPHHERSHEPRPLQLRRVPGQGLHLRLPPARSRCMRLRRELHLRQGLRLRQELMTNPSRGASRGATQQ